MDPITSLLLQLVWNDVTLSCLSGGFTHSSVEDNQQTFTTQRRGVGRGSDTRLTFNRRQGERGDVAVSFALQDVVHEGGVVTAGQRDLSVIQLLLQAVVEEAEQQLVGQTGSAVRLLLGLPHF